MTSDQALCVSVDLRAAVVSNDGAKVHHRGTKIHGDTEKSDDLEMAVTRKQAYDYTSALGTTLVARHSSLVTLFVTRSATSLSPPGRDSSSFRALDTIDSFGSRRDAPKY